MGLMDGKKGLILGVANDHSIAWGIAQALHREGAQLGFTYVGEALERRVRPLAQSLGAPLIEQCDVNSDAEIAALMERTRAVFGQIDFLIHAVAFANKDELNGAYLKTTRAGFMLAMEVSVYSLTAVLKAADELLAPNASVVTLTYHGAQKVITNYNVMGVAKAALEASVRYMAMDLGPLGIRVNAISAGPMRTLAGSAIGSARQVYRWNQRHAPLRRTVTLDELGGSALYLLSGLGAGVTGEVHHVDSGYNVIGMGNPDTPETADADA